MKIKDILLEMVNIYQTFEYDWMGFPITKKNHLTYHHILEKRNNGDESIENGALLGKKSHELLHLIERIDSPLYFKWQRIFKRINSLGQPVSDEVMEEIFELKEISLNVKEKALNTQKKHFVRQRQKEIENTCIY